MGISSCVTIEYECVVLLFCFCSTNWTNLFSIYFFG